MLTAANCGVAAAESPSSQLAENLASTPATAVPSHQTAEKDARTPRRWSAHRTFPAILPNFSSRRVRVSMSDSHSVCALGPPRPRAEWSRPRSCRACIRRQAADAAYLLTATLRRYFCRSRHTRGACTGHCLTRVDGHRQRPPSGGEHHVPIHHRFSRFSCAILHPSICSRMNR